MTVGKRRRWVWIVSGVLALLVAGGIVGFRVAVGALRDRVIDALGPESEIAELRVGWSSLDVGGLRITGPEGGPRTTRSGQSTSPSCPACAARYRASSTCSRSPSASPISLRFGTRDGRLQVLPSLLSRGTQSHRSGAAAARSVTIDRITLHDGVLDLFDASVAQPPLEIHLEQVEATVLDVVAPALRGEDPRSTSPPCSNGARQDGTVTIAGWAEIASRDSVAEDHAPIRRRCWRWSPTSSGPASGECGRGPSTSTCSRRSKRNRLHAPGQLTISGLELESGRGHLRHLHGLAP